MKISKIDYCVTLQAKVWFPGIDLIDPKKALFGKLIVFIKDSYKEWKLESSMFLSNTAPYFDVGSEFIQTADNAWCFSPVFNLFIKKAKLEIKISNQISKSVIYVFTCNLFYSMIPSHRKVFWL